jgi:hypothetical protein
MTGLRIRRRDRQLAHGLSARRGRWWARTGGRAWVVDIVTSGQGIRSAGRGQGQVLDDRAQRQRRHEGQRAHQQHRAHQQADEQRAVGGKRARATGHALACAASEPAMASTGTMTQ